MNTIERMADRVLSVFVPRATAAAAAVAGCEVITYCQPCGSKYKRCFAQYCDGKYRSGFCNESGSC